MLSTGYFHRFGGSNNSEVTAASVDRALQELVDDAILTAINTYLGNQGDLTTNVREILADFEETLRKSQQQFAGEIQEMCKYVPLG